MGFGGGINRLNKWVKKTLVPKEISKAVPKEIQPGYASLKTDEYLGYGPIPEEATPGIAPPEQIDEDAYRIRQRSRRRARGASTIRTSPSGAPYSPAPKSLLGS